MTRTCVKPSRSRTATDDDAVRASTDCGDHSPSESGYFDVDPRRSNQRAVFIGPSLGFGAVSSHLSQYRSVATRWWTSLAPLTSDAWLYGVSAIFAFAMGLVSREAAQWHWGFLAAGPFAIAAVLALLGGRVASVVKQRWRLLLIGCTFVGVVAIPLTLEIQWRQAQPEVGVIGRAGGELGSSKNPYQVICHDGHCIRLLKGVPAYESFFPYFPAMAIFGFPSAVTHKETGLSDARIAMSVFTGLLMIIALLLLRAPPNRKIRVAQVLVVLPTGSLFLATGGDDMPILALCLLALVALQRNRPWTTGVVLGVAGAMKLTAWPYALALIAVSRYSDGRRSWKQVTLAMGALLHVAITPFAYRNTGSFLSNVLAFPLGLAGVQSPAASPLPGHLLTTWWPPLRHVLLPAVFVVGGVFLAQYLRRHWPLDISRSLRVLAVVMTVVICSATSTRLGYMIYPLNFWLWAWVLAPSTPLREGVLLLEVDSPRGGPGAMSVDRYADDPKKSIGSRFRK